NILGQQIALDRQPYIVIGVMPRQFVFPLPGLVPNGSPADLWVPMAVTPAELQEWGGLYLTSVVGRLRRGVTPHQALAELNSLATAMLASYPAPMRNGVPGLTIAVTASAFHGEAVSSVRTLLLLLMASASLCLIL